MLLPGNSNSFPGGQCGNDHGEKGRSRGENATSRLSVLQIIPLRDLP